jgi:hypothetical protein
LGRKPFKAESPLASRFQLYATGGNDRPDIFEIKNVRERLASLFLGQFIDAIQDNHEIA